MKTWPKLNLLDDPEYRARRHYVRQRMKEMGGQQAPVTPRPRREPPSVIPQRSAGSSACPPMRSSGARATSFVPRIERSDDDAALNARYGDLREIERRALGGSQAITPMLELYRPGVRSRFLAPARRTRRRWLSSSLEWLLLLVATGLAAWLVARIILAIF